MKASGSLPVLPKYSTRRKLRATVFWVERLSAAMSLSLLTKVRKAALVHAGNALSHFVYQIPSFGQGVCADYRRTFQWRHFRTSIGHISPEAAAGGNIGKIQDGDIIEIDIPNRSINVKLTDEELAARPMMLVTRDRQVSKALKAYASMVSSADKGAVRLIE